MAWLSAHYKVISSIYKDILTVYVVVKSCSQNGKEVHKLSSSEVAVTETSLCCGIKLSNTLNL